jgi:two-component system chemotaxis response regulator CheY
MIDENMKVLIVDDFASMRRIVKNTLKQIGFKNIIEADDGTTALAMLKEQKIDLVLVDWNMPKMSGLELLKKVKKDEALKTIPVFLVTAEAQKENVIEAIQAGVSNYIVKPFTPDSMKQKLERTLAK